MNKTDAAGEEPAEPKIFPAERVRRFFSDLGPGLITGAAADDPARISTYSVTGTAFELFATL